MIKLVVLIAVASFVEAGHHNLLLHGAHGGLAHSPRVVSVGVVDGVGLATVDAAHARAAAVATSEAAASVAAAHRAASAVRAEAEARAESEARGAEAAVAATRARVAQVAHQEYAALADSHAKVAESARAEADARATSASHAERVAAAERARAASTLHGSTVLASHGALHQQVLTLPAAPSLISGVHGPALATHSVAVPSVVGATETVVASHAPIHGADVVVH